MKTILKPTSSWLFEFLPLIRAQPCFSCVHSYFRAQNPKFNLRGKMVQNLNFLLVSKNSDLSLNVNSTHQHKSMNMLDFQNKISSVKILKFHTTRYNSAYLAKRDFQRKIVFQFWDSHWIHGTETSPIVVSDSNFESLLVLHANKTTLTSNFYSISKNVTFYKWHQT